MILLIFYILFKVGHRFFEALSLKPLPNVLCCRLKTLALLQRKKKKKQRIKHKKMAYLPMWTLCSKIHFDLSRMVSCCPFKYNLKCHLQYQSTQKLNYHKKFHHNHRILHSTPVPYFYHPFSRHLSSQKVSVYLPKGLKGTSVHAEV